MVLQSSAVEKMVNTVTTASPNFWKDRQVLLTGHSGFKGAWMALWLAKMGARVTGISLSPDTVPSLFELADVANITRSHFVDIRDAGAVLGIVKEAKPEFVFHLAAQSLVRPGYRDPLQTFATNVMGTANVLNALRGIDAVRVVVAITTDKVYKNLESVYPYRETDSLGGHDPYSASKAASEMVISSFRDSYLAEQGVAVASARAGNVIGGGDWSESRLIPDAVRAWTMGSVLEIRRPDGVRPWQHVLEPINGYLVLAEKLYTDESLSGAYNFGPQTYQTASVRKVIEIAHKCFGSGGVSCGNGLSGPKEAGLLSLEISKARELLAVTPRWNLEESIERTIRWYKRQINSISAQALCESDISEFTGSLEVSNQ